MDAKQLAGHERRLKKLRAQLLAAGPARIEPTRKDAAGAGVAVADEDEQALTEMLQILASSQNQKQARQVGGIDRALRKIADAPESYGVCEECEDEIAPRRLELMPYATLCTECQSARDPRRGQARRSLTDFKP